MLPSDQSSSSPPVPAGDTREASQTEEFSNGPCHRCGRPDNAGIGDTCWFADNELWNEVIPGRTGMLCPACFTAACEEKGIGIGWRAGRIGVVESRLVAADTRIGEVEKERDEAIHERDAWILNSEAGRDGLDRIMAAEAELEHLRTGLHDRGFFVGRNPEGVDDTVAGTLLVVSEYQRDLEAERTRSSQLRDALRELAGEYGCGLLEPADPSLPSEGDPCRVRRPDEVETWCYACIASNSLDLDAVLAAALCGGDSEQ